MSKIAKKIIKIPTEVTVSCDGGIVSVSGPKGKLSVDTRSFVNINISNDQIQVSSKDLKNTQFAGLYRTLISNIVVGVKEGFSKKLEFNGIGYKASVNGGDLTLNVGYSHPVVIKKIDGIDFVVNDNIITVSGIDKVMVGDVAAKIRSVRKPEPYKGKGIKYLGEYIIRKAPKSKA